RETRHAILLTLAVAPVAVAVNVVFGVAAAWAIARFQFRGRTLLLTLIDVPFSVSPVVAGLLFVLLFGLRGYFGPWLQAHGVRVIFALPGRPEPRGERLADLLAGDAAEHPVGPVVRRHPVQCPGDGRVRGGLRRLRPGGRRDRHDAAARGEVADGV